MLSKVLIIDKRKELSIKYKKSLEDMETSTIIAQNLNDAIKDIQSIEPDLIMVSDSIDEDLTKFCEHIRSLTYNTRPIIVALSKSADINDRIAVLESGADDFLSEPVNIEEFKTRIKAHLRREIESNLDNKTLLPNNKMVYKSLKRILNYDTNRAVLMIGINCLEDYKSVYSDIAGDKLVQAFVAIAKSALDTGDFLGQLNDTTFVITTSPYRAEKVAEFLTFAFDTVLPKFYTEKDVKRGYMLIKGDRQAGMRAEFVSLQIGGILEGYDLISSVDALLERLYTIKKNSKIPSGSNYIIDRLKLSGTGADSATTTSGKIYIKESDEALYLLLRTTLELQGYDVTEYINIEDSIQPSIIILDSGNNLEELEFSKKLKNCNNFANSKIIMTTSIHNKTAILNAGADLYLPKPYELSDLIRWVEYFIKR
ncbi:MAG: response regulator [bacterium]|nr:response regulator [bacterium]